MQKQITFTVDTDKFQSAVDEVLSYRQDIDPDVTREQVEAALERFLVTTFEDTLEDAAWLATNAAPFGRCGNFERDLDYATRKLPQHA